MRTSIEQLMNHLGAKDLFNQSGLEFLRDGWAAAEFAGRRGAVSVRLVNADRPDFELMFADGAPEGFELVEGDIEGRKRGLEYKLAAASGWKATDRPIEEWATPVQAYEVLQAASLKKAGKAQELAAAGNPYPPDTNLLIYLNISDFGAHHEDIVYVLFSDRTRFSVVSVSLGIVEEPHLPGTCKLPSRVGPVMLPSVVGKKSERMSPQQRGNYGDSR